MGKLLTEFPTGSRQPRASQEGDESSILFHFNAGRQIRLVHLDVEDFSEEAILCHKELCLLLAGSLWQKRA